MVDYLYQAVAEGQKVWAETRSYDAAQKAAEPFFEKFCEKNNPDDDDKGNWWSWFNHSVF